MENLMYHSRYSENQMDVAAILYTSVLMDIMAHFCLGARWEIQFRPSNITKISGQPAEYYEVPVP